MRMCGEWRGGGADAEPPVGPMFVGGEGPATAWTVYRQREMVLMTECCNTMWIVGQTRQKQKDRPYIHGVDLMRARQT